MSTLVGCDPEFFLRDKETGNFVSAHNMIPGTKQEPHKLDLGACQVDGTAVEFNIEPAKTAKEFETNILTVLRQVREMIPERYEFSFTPAIWYPENYFQSLPDYTKVLGCDPDYSADKNGEIIERHPENFPGLRTGSGHIHVGWTKDADPYDVGHFEDCKMYAKWFSREWSYVRRAFDNDEDRSKLYGSGSPFRPKSYGVEVRTPSNAWLRNKDNYKVMFKFAINTEKALLGKTVDYGAFKFNSWKA